MEKVKTDAAGEGDVRRDASGMRRHDEIDVPEKTGLFAKIAIFLIFAIPLVCFIVMCRFMKWL